MSRVTAARRRAVRAQETPTRTAGVLLYSGARYRGRSRLSYVEALENTQVKVMIVLDPLSGPERG